VSVAVDHLVVRAPDLDAGVSWFEGLTGVRPAPGGSHPGMGTRNALASLGDDVYVEIIAPDPAQPLPPGGRPFAVDDAGTIELVSFAVHPVGGVTIDEVAAAARAAGHDLGPIASMSRTRPDGTELSWRLTMPPGGDADPVVPFVIDWGDTPTPAASTPTGCTLRSLRIEHPGATELGAVLAAIGLGIRVDAGPRPTLWAELDTPSGPVALGPDAEG
jgi:hypothetical protein